jgi:AcrR family transcriptional regulator
LRQRKKLATREALGAAALRLAIERGLGNVRVSDIAAAAGVSPRTYNNYFSSREEAICAVGTDRTRRLVDALRARPVGEPLAEALVHAMADQHEHHEPDKRMLRMIWADPALRAEFLKSTAVLQRLLAAAIAERVGCDGERDLTPRVVAAAYEGAARAATQFWLREECMRPLSAVMREALALLAPVAGELERHAGMTVGAGGGADVAVGTGGSRGGGAGLARAARTRRAPASQA